MVLGLLDQLQIFLLFSLIELLGLLTGLGYMSCMTCYIQDFDRVWHAVFFTNLSFMEFLVGYLALCPLFSVIDDFEWLLMISPHKNILVIPCEMKKVPTWPSWILMKFCQVNVIIKKWKSWKFDCLFVNGSKITAT